MKKNKDTLLALGGFDSSGAAGLTIDLRVGSSLGVRTLPLITTMTFQNDLTFHKQIPFSKTILVEQFQNQNKERLGVIKLGALGSVSNFRGLWPELVSLDIPILIDPVLKTSTGGLLIEADSADEIRNFYRLELAPKAFLMTPNYEEALFLLNLDRKDEISLAQLAHHFQNEWPSPVLLKGGHAPGKSNEVKDLLIKKSEILTFGHPYQAKRTIRATGCALTCAIASFLLLEGYDLKAAYKNAVNKLLIWMENAEEVQSGIFHLNIR